MLFQRNGPDDITTKYDELGSKHVGQFFLPLRIWQIWCLENLPIVILEPWSLWSPVPSYGWSCVWSIFDANAEQQFIKTFIVHRLNKTKSLTPPSLQKPKPKIRRWISISLVCDEIISHLVWLLPSQSVRQVERRDKKLSLEEGASQSNSSAVDNQNNYCRHF